MHRSQLDPGPVGFDLSDCGSKKFGCPRPQGYPIFVSRPTRSGRAQPSEQLLKVTSVIQRRNKVFSIFYQGRNVVRFVLFRRRSLRIVNSRLTTVQLKAV